MALHCGILKITMDVSMQITFNCAFPFEFTIISDNEMKNLFYLYFILNSNNCKRTGEIVRAGEQGMKGKKRISTCWILLTPMRYKGAWQECQRNFEHCRTGEVLVMTELGQIQPEKKIACPHCGSILSDDVIAAIAGEEKEGGAPCSHCGRLVKLPEKVMDKIRRSRHLGKNLDITI